jgi:hypothetical protein
MILLLYSISCRLHIDLEQLLGFRPLDPADLQSAKAGAQARTRADGADKRTSAMR